MMEPMRLFIGIPVPPDAVSRIRDIQDDLKDHVSRGTFSDEGNFHLTLAFLGGTDPDRVPSLIKALSPSTERSSPSPSPISERSEANRGM